MLDIQYDIEDAIKNELAIKYQEVKRVELRLEELIRDNHANEALIEQSMVEGCTLLILRQLSSRKEYLQNNMTETRRELGLLELEIEGIQQRLAEAMKKRKIYEKLKENDFNRYLEAIEIEEKKVTEEIVNYQNYLKRGEE